MGIKRVVDYNVKIRVDDDGSGVITDNLKMSINPFDEIAVEAALQLKEAGKASEIIALTIGSNESLEQLKTALAMGADRAIHIECEEEIQPLTCARIFKNYIDKEKPKLVILGKQAIDKDNSQTAQMIAALTNWPQATFASTIEIEDEKAVVTREVDAGLETLAIDLPAVISTDLRLNKPRYIKLPDIMRAKQKPIETLQLEEINIESAKAIKVIKTVKPEPRKSGIFVETAEELISALKKKGLIE